MAQAQIEAEREKVQLARREWIPDPSISVQVQRYNATEKAISEFDTGIAISIPWGNAGKYAAQTREANSSLAAAAAELEGARNEATQVLRDQMQKIETLRHHVELFQDTIVPQARQAFEATQSAYETGKGGFAEWITAQRMLRDVQANELSHQTDYQIAIAELEGVVGADISRRPQTNRNQGQTKSTVEATSRRLGTPATRGRLYFGVFSNHNEPSSGPPSLAFEECGAKGWRRRLLHLHTPSMKIERPKARL